MVEKMSCSPFQMKNKGIYSNNFQLGADISFFLVIGAGKKNSQNGEIVTLVPE
jgi:hypothetical protein